MRSVLFQRLAQGAAVVADGILSQFDPRPHFLQDGIGRISVDQNFNAGYTEWTKRSVGSRPVTNNSAIFCELERGGGGIVFHANSTVINQALKLTRFTRSSSCFQ